MEKLMREYCRNVHMKYGSVRFQFDGERIDPSATPQSLELESDFCIDVVPCWVTCVDTPWTFSRCRHSVFTSLFSISNCRRPYVAEDVPDGPWSATVWPLWATRLSSPQLEHFCSVATLWKSPRIQLWSGKNQGNCGLPVLCYHSCDSHKIIIIWVVSTVK